MKKWWIALTMGLAMTAHAQQKDYTKLVNPFIGTGGHGHTYPGPSMPFGMVQLSPDTRLKGWDGCSGYHYSDSTIYGFSHTHLSGTGIEDYCDILLMPTTGKFQWDNESYSSPFSHKQEQASPGLYSVKLHKYDIDVKLTATQRVGLHAYTFPKGAKTGHVLLDLYHRDIVKDATFKVLNDSTILGMRRSTSWAQDQVLYFALRFSQPVKEWQVALDNEEKGALKTAQGRNIKTYFSFDIQPGKPLYAKVAISGVSEAGALQNMEAELPHFRFNEVVKAAKDAWNKELGRIEIKGGTADQQTIFYSALYHACLNPNLYMDVDGQFRGTDKQLHRATGFTNYSVFSLWDTHRALHPLMTIIDQRRTADWINTFLAQYRYGGMLPVWELSANETFCMIGYHSVPVIADAYQKGIRGFDSSYALEAMRSYAEGQQFGMQDYIRQGYLSADVQAESVSRTLEYSYDDWCIAQMAKWLGQPEVYNRYMKRAQSYKNLFDASTGFMRGKNGSRWMAPFDPTEVNNFYTEANAWQYSFAVQQDVSGLMALYGGRDKFIHKLNELFTTELQLSGRHQADITGLIGQYAHGNEPSHHIAYLFNYAGQPWRTQELLNRIYQTQYHNAPDGLSGNEDCGQMSAWYVLSTMGFYSVTPASGIYAIGSPLFEEVKIHLENGKTFVIKANNRTAKNGYIQSARLNGKTYTKSYLAHTYIMQGGTLQFDMGGAASKWGSAAADLPVSAITDVVSVPAPYTEADADRFLDQMSVSLKTVTPGLTIHYTTDGSTPAISSPVYNNPLTIKNTTTLHAIACKDGSCSQVATAVFHKIPTDKTIQVLSKIHPQFTGGGNDALIDGIRGKSDFRLGAWQSHYPGDLEAVIDLKSNRDVRKISLSVLQDLAVWIWYPTQVEYFTSTDGKTFVSLGVVKNTFSDREYGTHQQELTLPVHINTRYIKVKATTHGTIPDWHPGKGEPCHIFADEIIVE